METDLNYLRMTPRDLERRDIFQRLVRRELTVKNAALQLKISVRHAKRLKARVKQRGLTALLHARRGAPSPNRLPERERKQILTLLHEKYYDFGPTFAAEKLRELHHIDRDPKTIRTIMASGGLWKPKQKRRKELHRAWRLRRASYGELIQFDGSYEHWFEERGGEICLLAAIDDATGRIAGARFDSDEGVVPVFGFWEQYMVKNGKPLAIYLDKFSTYHMNHPLAKENTDTLTQFQRAMQTLRIEVIPANSPQAKGRVERLFGTLQDRLIKELRLQKIHTIEAANEFLSKKFIPDFNKRFAVAPRSQTNLHRPLGKKEVAQLPAILSRHSERTVRNDYTISFNNQWYQLTADQPATVCKNDTVTVEERRNQTIWIKLRGKYLNYRLLPARPPRANSPWVLPATTAKRSPAKPPANHPWRLRMHTNVLQSQLTKKVTF